MVVESIDIERFLDLAKTHPVFDVRSPGEFTHAHFPGAIPLPLFTDEQRKIIGTTYKQQSRQDAVNLGLAFFSDRMKLMHQEVVESCHHWKEHAQNYHPIQPENTVLVHCWRGGMRSGAVGWLLSLYGYKVYTLKGGYKAFRKWVLHRFEQPCQLHVLGGYTGSGKTELLQEMQRRSFRVIDLEKLANHKGSAFGSLGEAKQPGQEMFENLLALELHKVIKNDAAVSSVSDPADDSAACQIWLEDESRHIGTVGIPGAFWTQMRAAPLYFLEIQFEERLKHIVNRYGIYPKEDLANAIARIQKRLGGLNAKRATEFLVRGDLNECFGILLHYYDRYYQESLLLRENIATLLNKIPCPTVDINNVQHFVEINA